MDRHAVASEADNVEYDHGLAPHRWRSFKLSNDKAFAEKLHDVVALYVSPPAHAIVLSVDEKSQIQALDRTQPGLPLKRGRGATMTRDYKRNGTTTLFAALNILDGSLICGAAIKVRARIASSKMFLNVQPLPTHKLLPTEWYEQGRLWDG